MPFIISLVMITLLLPRKFLDFTCIYSPFLFHWYLYSLFHRYSVTHLVLVMHLSGLVLVTHVSSTSFVLVTCQLYCNCYSFVSSTSLVLVTHVSSTSFVLVTCQLYFTCNCYSFVSSTSLVLMISYFPISFQPIHVYFLQL